MLAERPLRTRERTLKPTFPAVVHVPAGTVERSTVKVCSLVELSFHVRRAELVVMSDTVRAEAGTGAEAAARVRPET